MFLVELVAGADSGSGSLAADAADFAGDAENYGISLAALGLPASAQVIRRARNELHHPAGAAV